MTICAQKNFKKRKQWQLLHQLHPEVLVTVLGGGVVQSWQLIRESFGADKD